MTDYECGDKTVIKTYVPIKSTIDNKQYRSFTLPNEMKITLISDPSTDKSAVSMNVSIGALSDPRNIMGLAHFCEHMVFMGSEKYPEENYYSKYFSQNNGSYNAYTSQEDTNFLFEINPPNLLEAIDIFAQFFISPLFTESATDRELLAVNSEHEKNICNDMRRLTYIEHYLSDEKHDYNKFSTGNIKTLKEDPEKNNINVRQALLDFHDRYYSANIMGLCVLGKESLDTLQDVVVDLFSNVVNKKVEVPYWNDHPWTEEYVKQIVYVTPVKDCYQIMISWPIPDYQKLYLSKPGNYVSHLLGHEGKGSILALLKKKRWGNKLVSSIISINGFAKMSLIIDLFEDGINYVNEIITIIYQYLLILKSEEPQEWIYDEERNISESRFRFRELSNLQYLVSELSQNMKRYNTEHILQGPFLMTDYKPDLIKTIINCLKPSQMRVFCVAKKFESICNKEENVYNIKYAVDKIPKEQIEMWENVEFNTDLFLPGINQYISTDFSIKSISEDKTIGPELIRDNNLSRWWFCQDDYYLLPKAFIFINFTNTLAIKDPVCYVMNAMLSDLFSDAINEQIYDADLADLTFIIYNSIQGLQMQFMGYNEKMPVFINDMITKLVTFVTDQARFNVIKENKFREIQNFDMERPPKQGDKMLSCLISEVMWTKEDLLTTMDDITLENFAIHFKRFFSQFHTEALIYGNFKSNEAICIINEVEAIVNAHFIVKPLVSSQIITLREVLFPENSNYVFHFINTHDATSALITYLQTSTRTTRNNVMTKLCSNLLEEPLFDQLRTKEQLGYLVGNDVKVSNSMQGIRIYIQSNKTPAELDGRVSSALINYKTTLEEMSDEEYLKYITALKHRLLEKPKDMIKQAAKYLSEIMWNHFNFNRDIEESEALMSVSKQDMVEYYNKYIDPGSKYLKKLSVYVVSEKTHGSTIPSYAIEENITMIDNIAQFKKGLPLSSLIMPALPPLKEAPTAKL